MFLWMRTRAFEGPGLWKTGRLSRSTVGLTRHRWTPVESAKSYRKDSRKLLMRVLKSPSRFLRSSILRMEWITVE
jgi:hypothetical protein